MVPSGAAGRNIIDKNSRLLNLWTNDAPLKNIVLKAIHVMYKNWVKDKMQKTIWKHKKEDWDYGKKGTSPSVWTKVKSCKRNGHQETLKWIKKNICIN